MIENYESAVGGEEGLCKCKWGRRSQGASVLVLLWWAYLEVMCLNLVGIVEEFGRNKIWVGFFLNKKTVA